MCAAPVIANAAQKLARGRVRFNAMEAALARTGYLGTPIIRPGGRPPAQIALPSGSVLTVSNIPRKTGLDSHVANVKARNIIMDAAVILARHYDFLTNKAVVALAPARYQHFGATGGQHAAHAVKMYIFNSENIA